MNAEEIVAHLTDDMGNDVVQPVELDEEYRVLCAVADAADEQHRAHCLLRTVNCPICKALADLDLVRQKHGPLHRN